MSDLDYNRISLRAPLKSEVIFAVGDICTKALAINVSKNGVLMQMPVALPAVTVELPVALMLDIPFLRDLAKLSREKLMDLDPSEYQRNIIHCLGRLKRINVSTPMPQYGVHFDRLEEITTDQIEKYVYSFEKNITYLLNLIEDLGVKKENFAIAKKVAELLGYSFEEKIAVLRQKVLHDYQSLKEL